MPTDVPPKAVWDTLWNRPENTRFASGPSFRHKLRKLLRLIETYGIPGTVLDVACGTGELLQSLPAKYQALTGSDASQAALQKAKKILPDATFYLQNIEEDSLERTFDMIFCTNALEEMENDTAAIRNMTSMLSQKGRLFLVVPHRKRYWTRKDREAGNKRRYEIDQMRDLLDKAGLQPITLHTWGWPLYRVWYQLMSRVNQDTVWQTEQQAKSANLAAQLAYMILFFDDLFTTTRLGSILFVVAEHKR